jgi:outer membrane immunogenic protein
MRPPLAFYLLGLTCANTALAADLPINTFKAPVVAPATDWSGFYVGLGAGFRSSSTGVNVSSAHDTSALPGQMDPFVEAGCSSGLPCFTGARFNGVAPQVSPYLGYNWQANSRWVFGIEADAAFGSQTTREFGTYPATPLSGGLALNAFSVETSWNASVRGRVGYLVEPGVMIYGTAGPAWQHLESTSTCGTSDDGVIDCPSTDADNLMPASITHATTKLGVTAGAGIEAMVAPNWILRGEYRFSDYGSANFTDVRTSPDGVFTVNYGVHLTTNTATFGIAYKFGNDSAQPASPLSAYGAAPESLSWTGAHIGAGIGLRADQTTASLEEAMISGPGTIPMNILAECHCAPDSGMNSAAFRFAPYIGYDWQFTPRWLVGIEGDFGWAKQTSTVDGHDNPGPPVISGSFGVNDSYNVTTKWDASVRLRLGYVASPGLLVYATAGPSWISLNETSTCDTMFTAVLVPGVEELLSGACIGGVLAPYNISHSEVRTGYTIGGGAEMRLDTNWVARFEYRYADYGTARFDDSRSCNGTATFSSPALGMIGVGCFLTAALQTGVHVQTNTATFGIAYKFD